MARRPRLFFEQQTLHLIQRGNNRSACFASERDRIVFLAMLAEIAQASKVALHAYVLMTNHVHLLGTPNDASGASRFMQRVGIRYTSYFNRTYGRSGSLWDGRFRAMHVDTDAYVLACYRYIEENPLRAGLVARPGDYPWTSHRGNTGGEPDIELQPHGAYLALGHDSSSRARAYSGLFAVPLDAITLESLRLGIPKGDRLGSDRGRNGV